MATSPKPTKTPPEPTGIQHFKKGDLVTWYLRPTGSYGYVVEIEGVVTKQVDREIVFRFFDFQRGKWNQTATYEKFLRPREKRTDIFFFAGEEKRYYGAFRAQLDGRLYARGRWDYGWKGNFSGDVVYQTYAEAKAEADKHDGWTVFGIDPVLEWDKGLTDYDPDVAPGRRLRWDCELLILNW